MGNNRPKSLRDAASKASTVFRLYCPVGCTGTVAGFHTDTTSSLTVNTRTSSAITGGSCLCMKCRTRFPPASVGPSSCSRASFVGVGGVSPPFIRAHPFASTHNRPIACAFT